MVEAEPQRAVPWAHSSWGVTPSYLPEGAAAFWTANIGIALDNHLPVFHLAFLSCLSTVPTSIFFPPSTPL